MKIILIIATLFLLMSCEKVVNIDLDTAPERLVVDANINWVKGTSGNTQTIKLTRSTGYYQNVMPKVSNATVTIKNSSNTIFNFIEEPSSDSNSGRYTCENFQPVLGETYTLTIISGGKTYTATERLLPTPDIATIEQENNLGLNNDEIGVKINFNDFPVTNDFYLLQTIANVALLPDYQITNDQFYQGNVMSGIYTHPDLIAGSILKFRLYGISESYHNYMKLLLNASSGSNNGPFQVTPTLVKGNIKNETDPKDLIFGYFRLGETAEYSYTIQ
ncbi:protein of unknown function [Kaistella chaponensis]|uniref:DUF4249 domain-containing protein n=1 Tax=Kaistella chaponensis TaxID=713588 RepID=A0A1N7L5U6_9FLAO|nr:DUF4249 domain-containing protein [Kaistella chaponensis]SIS69209.1 protein of unknown function [Kaistella chaponensis]